MPPGKTSNVCLENSKIQERATSIFGFERPWRSIDAEAPFLTQGWINLVETGIVGLAAGLAIPPSRLECSLPVEDRNVCNSVLHTGKMKTEFVRILPHVQSFFSGLPRDLYH